MSKEYLDRKQVDKIITVLIKDLSQINRGVCDNITGNPMQDYVINQKNVISKAITEICKLKPKNQVVIAEGNIIELSWKFFKETSIRQEFSGGPVKILLEEG